MKKEVTNYGKLLAEIQYYESIGNDYQVERLTKLLDKAREKDEKISKLKEAQAAD